MMTGSDEKWRRRARRRNKERLDPTSLPSIEKQGFWSAFKSGGFWRRFEVIVVLLLLVAAAIAYTYLYGSRLGNMIEGERTRTGSVEMPNHPAPPTILRLTT